MIQTISSVCVSMNIVKWSSQGMLRLTQEAMNELFQPTIINIVKHIGERDTHRYVYRLWGSWHIMSSQLLPYYHLPDMANLFIIVIDVYLTIQKSQTFTLF